MKLDSEACTKLFWILDSRSSTSNKYWPFVILASCLKCEKGLKLIFLKIKVEQSWEKKKKEPFYILKKYVCFNVQSFIPLYYQFQETENTCALKFSLCFHFLIMKSFKLTILRSFKDCPLYYPRYLKYERYDFSLHF